MSAAAGAKFVMWIAPLRPRAEAGFHPAASAALWDAVRAEVEAGGGCLLGHVPQTRFTDEEFTDYAHPNQCGAARWTALMAAQTAANW